MLWRKAFGYMYNRGLEASLKICLLSRGGEKDKSEKGGKGPRKGPEKVGCSGEPRVDQMA